MMVHACNPSTLKAEAGELRVPNQLEQGKALSPRKEKQTHKIIALVNLIKMLSTICLPLFSVSSLRVAFISRSFLEVEGVGISSRSYIPSGQVLQWAIPQVPTIYLTLFLFIMYVSE